MALISTEQQHGSERHDDVFVAMHTLQLQLKPTLSSRTTKEEDQRDNNDDETNVVEKADCKALVKDENSNGGTGKTKHNNNDNGGEDNDLMDTDDDGGNSKPAAAAAKKLAKKEGGSKGGGSSGSKKRIIDDSDSEEDNDVAEKEATTANSGEKEKQAASKMMDADKEEEEEYKQEPEDESGGSTASVHSEEEISEMKKAAAAGKKSSNEDDDDDEFFAPKSKKQKTNTTTTKKTLSSKSATGTKSASTAANMKSNAQLSSLLTSKINSDPDGWKADKPTPYSALCDTFSEIEAISSRLEIQERMTELFRMVLIRDGGGDGDWKETSGKKKSDDKEKSNGKDTDALRSDLYPLLYLASNSVAPSYECVELGVGDSILVKAIGEASGTNPQMIKKKYEKEGDLGTVAQTSKGKQKTLIGFGKLSGPKRLDVREVLKVFREIVSVRCIGCAGDTSL
jgi:DNA ligase-1